MFYGNEEKKRKPSKTFIKEIKQYDNLKEIMFGIESLINKRSSHASGVLLNNEDPYEYACYMRTPKGEVVTQWDLHDLEYAGGVKVDYLVTEITDKLVLCLELMKKYKVIEDLSIRELYNKYLHPRVIDKTNDEIWNNLRDGKVLDVFQFSESSGLSAAKKLNPRTIEEMSQANAVMRLMPIDNNDEQPIDKYARLKKNFPKSWYDEMKKYNLSTKNIESIKGLYEPNYGFICLQEDFMRILLEFANFSLKETNEGKAIVAKKKMDKIPELKEKFFNAFDEKNFAQYLWDTGILPQLGYAFNKSHTFGYSYVGLQSLVLSTNWNPVYWNTACLIVNSGALEDAEYVDDSDEDFKIEKEGQRKERTTDYGKIAKALGMIISKGIKISLVDINKSFITFEPDEKNNSILFGMKGLSRINKKAVEDIISKRPFISFNDFYNRCKLSKLQIVSLIKSGAFDNLEMNWAKELDIEPRTLIMIYYLSKIVPEKTKLTLANFNSLMSKGLLSHYAMNTEAENAKKLFIINKRIKLDNNKENYIIDNKSYEELKDLKFMMDDIEYDNNIMKIDSKVWEKAYKSHIDSLRKWLKQNEKDLLNRINYLAIKEEWDKYAKGNVSFWEMESLCFYYHEHELANIDKNKYGIVDFGKLNPITEVDYHFTTKENKSIPIYKIHRIVGTVIGKNDSKSSISLLTVNDGVVNVKFNKEYYAMMNKQISVIEDGKKKILESSWFKRGVKVLIQGYRREDTFVCKTYSKTPGHSLYVIKEVSSDGELALKHDRGTF